MTPRPRSRPLLSKIVLLVRASQPRYGGMRLFIALFTMLFLVGSASIGFALNQDQYEEAVGLQGVWPDFPPSSLSTESFARLDGNWQSWGQDTAVDVAELYSLSEKNLEQQRQALDKVKSRIRVLRKALNDPAYASIRDTLTSIYASLSLRAELFEKSLDVITAENAPVAAGQAQNSKLNEVRNALSALESDLRSVPKGEAWLPYINAQAVRTSLSTPAAADVLAPLPRKLDPTIEGRTDAQKQFLNRKSFRRFANAVENYLAVARISQEGVDQNALRERLAALVEAVDSHEYRPTSETARDIRNARNALQRAAGPVALPLDDMIRKQYLNYNFRLVADESFLSKLVSAQDINSGAVRDYFMGARIYGNQTTSTNVNLAFIPSNDVARFSLNLSGVSNSRTNAYTDQATISSVGQHQFYATKPISFDGDRFQIGPTDLSVSPSIRHVGAATKYDNILFGLFKGTIRRKALTEANKRLPAGRAHAAGRLQENVLPEFDSEVDKNFGGLNNDIANFEARLRQKQLAPAAERTRTTSDRFMLDSAVRGGEEISGSPVNIGSTRGVGFTLQIHESLLNNMADRWGFAGRTMTDKQVREELRTWFSELLGRDVKLSDDNAAESKEPTTLIFDDQDPVRFRIVDGTIVLILRAGIQQEDGEEIPPQIVEVPLSLSMGGGQIQIVRGDVTVTPIDPPRNRALQITRAGAMRRRLEQAIEGGTSDGVINVEREGRSPTSIAIQRVDARGGWLTIYGI